MAKIMQAKYENKISWLHAKLRVTNYDNTNKVRFVLPSIAYKQSLIRGPARSQIRRC